MGGRGGTIKGTINGLSKHIAINSLTSFEKFGFKVIASHQCAANASDFRTANGSSNIVLSIMLA